MGNHHRRHGNADCASAAVGRSLHKTQPPWHDGRVEPKPLSLAVSLLAFYSLGFQRSGLTLRSRVSYNQRIRTAEFSGREAFWALIALPNADARQSRKERRKHNRRHRWNT